MNNVQFYCKTGTEESNRELQTLLMSRGIFYDFGATPRLDAEAVVVKKNRFRPCRLADIANSFRQTPEKTIPEAVQIIQQMQVPKPKNGLEANVRVQLNGRYMWLGHWYHWTVAPRFCRIIEYGYGMGDCVDERSKTPIVGYKCDRFGATISTGLRQPCQVRIRRLPEQEFFVKKFWGEEC